MANLQFLPRWDVPIPGTGNVYSLTMHAVTLATSGVIGALGARLFTHLSPKRVGRLFALATLVAAISVNAMDFLKKPKNADARAPQALATAGLCAAILCHTTIVPLTVRSAVKLPFMTTVATLIGIIVARQIVEGPSQDRNGD